MAMRLAQRFGVSLLLGAFVTFAASAWIGLRAPLGGTVSFRTGRTPIDGGRHDWQVLVQESRARRMLASSWAVGPAIDSRPGDLTPSDPAAELIPPWASFASPDESQPGSVAVACVAIEAGWPLLAFAGGIEDRSDRNGQNFHFAWLPASWRQSTPTLIPLRPLPLGLAVNSTLAAAPILVLWTTVAWFLDRRRRRRSLCPVCQYPLGQTIGCSECGSGRPA